MLCSARTCSEVDDEIEQKDGVGDAVEDDPARTEVVVEERDGDGQDDQVSDQQDQHEQVPVKPTASNDQHEQVPVEPTTSNDQHEQVPVETTTNKDQHEQVPVEPTTNRDQHERITEEHTNKDQHE